METNVEKISFVNTAMKFNQLLSDFMGTSILLEGEKLQMVEAHKIRRIYDKISSLSEVGRYMGVVFVGSDKLAMAVAYCCNRLGVKSIIYIPKDISEQKLASLRESGGSMITLRLTAFCREDCYAKASAFAMASGRTFIDVLGDRK